MAAYITAMPRPDMPGKERDYPRGNAPSDVPYATAGHNAARTIKVLPRATPENAAVPAPRRVGGPP